MAAMGWNRKSYGVPAQRGMRVLYTGCGHQEFGPIRSAANGGRSNIQFDGNRPVRRLKPRFTNRHFT